MYTTKLLNKNIVEGGKYISIGDSYKDPKRNMFRETKKGENLAPFKTPKAVAEVAKLTYSPSPYVDSIKYLKSQPPDKRRNGFGTHDANKRDEFTNEIRTEQFRESIRKEHRFTNKYASAAAATDLLKSNNQDEDDGITGYIATKSSTVDFPYNKKIHIYDLGRTLVTEFNPKAKRDQYYKPATDREKVYGAFRPQSAEIGRFSADPSYYKRSQSASQGRSTVAF